MQHLRSLIFFIIMVITIIPFSILVVVLFFLPYNWRYAIGSQWAKFNVRSLKFWCDLGYEIEGEENIPDSASIIYAKHQSAWETLALQQFFPPQVWVMKRELIWVPIFGWALASMGSIAIDRSSGRKAVKSIIDQGTASLNKGRWVVIFPEGTRVAPGQRKKYGMGGALLAEHSGYPIVPVAHNAGEYWRRRGLLKRRGTIKVVIGKPIPTEGRKASEINAEAEEWIESTMARITTLPKD